jgi:hypothetical protein
MDHRCGGLSAIKSPQSCRNVPQFSPKAPKCGLLQNLQNTAVQEDGFFP